jgi:hypothetical protein
MRYEMDDFLERQLLLLQQAVVDYRSEALSLNELVQKVEAIGNVVGGKLWEDQLFEVVVGLERINSEVIDKARKMTSEEQERVQNLLNQIEVISAHG